MKTGKDYAVQFFVYQNSPLFRNLPFRLVKSDFARAGTLQIQAAHGRQPSALPQQSA
ncbi:TPA: hypothetical protein ACFM7A_001275 [Neisseria meningitidis]|jgi:hypothetical protein|uniref:hypothetical protein n=1 Tax=Neisseria meningitidis TaxID=487 RepID=UPI000312B773|nr:hypothetical protein [Neisseria meningitidis]MBG9070680.1 hypothetical protein [Neisseria meningitidis]MBG9197282.1 hypothetical protein [Neisseria meningitidis]MBG9201182.1 hypothetical protein [Neisseria meningitidis]MBH2182007.1 hypothetical protein [Neisseria meningitidis]MBH2224915.1 hypothetical protein [Neisseria meningitidis]